jgi:hypothetical protein
MQKLLAACTLNGILCLRLRLAERQWRSASACILAKLRRAQVVVGHLLARNGMFVVKGYHTRIRPEHRVLAKLVRAVRVLGKGRGQERHVVGLGVRPPLLKGRVPERKVFQPEDLPYAVLLDILVLVDASFPPLYEATRVRVFDALVRAGRHHATEAALRAGTFEVHVDNALDLRVIEQKAMDGAVAAFHKGIGEAPDVEAPHALLAIVAAAEELDARVGVVRVELSNLGLSAVEAAYAIERLTSLYRHLSR